MSESRKVIVAGGFSEASRLLEPVAQAFLDRPDFGVTDATEPYSVNRLFTDPEGFAAAVKGNLLATHSAGAMSLNPEILGFKIEPSEIITFNGVEPTPRRSLVAGAMRGVWRDRSIGYEPQIKPFTMHEPAKELVSHPGINLKVFNNCTRFSTLEEMQKYRDSVEKRTMIFAEEDCFGFNSPSTIIGARSDRIKADMIPEGHNGLLARPKDTIAKAEWVRNGNLIEINEMSPFGPRMVNNLKSYRG